MSRQLFPILVLALAACADEADVVAPQALNADLQATSQTVWFVTNPPEPALVGDAYDVHVEASGYDYSLHLGSLTPWVCSVDPGFTDSSTMLWATVTFLEAGDCNLVASDSYSQVHQIFPVYEPSETPAPIFKACTKTLGSKTLSFEIPLDRNCPPDWD